MDFDDVLKLGNLDRLVDSRDRLCEKLFHELEENKKKLHKLLPELNQTTHNLRLSRKYNVQKCATDRFKKSFISEYVSQRELKS